MSLNQIICTALEEIPGLEERVYPLSAMKNATPPFVFYLQNGERESQALDGGTALQEASFAIHCVAQNYDGLSRLATAVKGALRGLQGQTKDGVLLQRTVCAQTSPDLYEHEVHLFRRAYGLTIDYQEETV